MTPCHAENLKCHAEIYLSMTTYLRNHFLKWWSLVQINNTR